MRAGAAIARRVRPAACLLWDRGAHRARSDGRVRSWSAPASPGSPPPPPCTVRAGTSWSASALPRGAPAGTSCGSRPRASPPPTASAPPTALRTRLPADGVVTGVDGSRAHRVPGRRLARRRPATRWRSCAATSRPRCGRPAPTRSRSASPPRPAARSGPASARVEVVLVGPGRRARRRALRPRRRRRRRALRGARRWSSARAERYRHEFDHVVISVGPAAPARRAVARATTSCSPSRAHRAPHGVHGHDPVVFFTYRDGPRPRRRRAARAAATRWAPCARSTATSPASCPRSSTASTRRAPRTSTPSPRSGSGRGGAAASCSSATPPGAPRSTPARGRRSRSSAARASGPTWPPTPTTSRPGSRRGRRAHRPAGRRRGQRRPPLAPLLPARQPGRRPPCAGRPCGSRRGRRPAACCRLWLAGGGPGGPGGPGGAGDDAGIGAPVGRRRAPDRGDVHPTATSGSRIDARRPRSVARRLVAAGVGRWAERVPPARRPRRGPRHPRRRPLAPARRRTSHPHGRPLHAPRSVPRACWPRVRRPVRARAAACSDRVDPSRHRGRRVWRGAGRVHLGVPAVVQRGGGGAGARGREGARGAPRGRRGRRSTPRSVRSSSASSTRVDGATAGLPDDETVDDLIDLVEILEEREGGDDVAVATPRPPRSTAVAQAFTPGRRHRRPGRRRALGSSCGAPRCPRSSPPRPPSSTTSRACAPRSSGRWDASAPTSCSR